MEMSIPQVRVVLDFATNPWLLASVFVVIQAVVRFNTPPSSRSMTTPSRYYTCASVYAAMTLLGSVILALSPDVVEWVGAGNIIPADARDRAPYVAALVMTVLLPRIPQLTEFDRWLRGRLHDLAAIPYEAIRLSTRLRTANFLIPEPVQQSVRDLLVDHGFDASDVHFEPPLGSAPSEAKYLWTKLSAFVHYLRAWKDGTDRRFSGFLRAFSSELEAIEAQYALLGGKARRLFPLIASNSTVEPERAAIRELTTNFRREVVALQKAILDFISRAMLSARRTERSRLDALRELGFMLGEDSLRPLFDKIAVLFLALSAVFFVTIVVLGSPNFPLSRRLLFVPVLAVIYCVAVIWALAPKRKRPESAERGRPVASYLSAAIGAAFSAVLFSVLMEVLYWRRLPDVLGRLPFLWSWSLLSFVTCLVTTFHADNRSGVRWGRVDLRWIEGASQACATAVAASVVYFLLSQLNQQCQGASCRPPPPLWRMLLNGGVIGFVIGTLVPTWYREYRLVQSDVWMLKIPRVLDEGRIEMALAEASRMVNGAAASPCSVIRQVDSPNGTTVIVAGDRSVIDLLCRQVQDRAADMSVAVTRASRAEIDRLAGLAA
jgi:hypothetical protein